MSTARATRSALHDGWMDSGDLGYWADGEIFITGREKDLIVRGGRHICPQEVEEIVASVAGIRPNGVATFGISDPLIGTERFIVVAEASHRDHAGRERLQCAVRDRVISTIGTPPDVVVIVDADTVLKTSSGKIRRGAMREAYVKGTWPA